MNLLLPNNIFATILKEALIKRDSSINIINYPSSLLSSKLKEDENSIALIPTTDLLSNPDFLVSKNVGISFESELSNSYFYFEKDSRDINELNLLGDISSFEIILSKIFFKETYDIDVEINLIASNQNIAGKNLLLTGSTNFEKNLYTKGLSFTGELVDMLEVPIVNFIFASVKKENIEKLDELATGIEQDIYSTIETADIIKSLTIDSQTFVKENISSIIYNFNEQDIEGINQMIRLPFYYGITKDIVEINFV